MADSNENYSATDIINDANKILDGYVQRQDAQQQQERARQFARDQQMTSITAQMVGQANAFHQSSLQNQLSQALSAGVNPNSVLDRNGSSASIGGATANPSVPNPLPTVYSSVLQDKSLLAAERKNDIDLMLGLLNNEHLDKQLKHTIESSLRDYMENVRQHDADNQFKTIELQQKRDEFQQSITQFEEQLALSNKALEQSKAFQDKEFEYKYKALSQQMLELEKRMQHEVNMLYIQHGNARELQKYENDFKHDEQQLQNAFTELMHFADVDAERELAVLRTKLMEAFYREKAWIDFKYGQINKVEDSVLDIGSFFTKHKIKGSK